jgi:hypothetical protein
LFYAVTVAVVAILGRSGFWNRRGARPAGSYPLLVAGAMLSAAIPLMIPSAGRNTSRHRVAQRGMPRLAQKHRFST